MNIKNIINKFISALKSALNTFYSIVCLFGLVIIACHFVWYAYHFVLYVLIGLKFIFLKIYNFITFCIYYFFDLYYNHHKQPKDSVIGLCLANLIAWTIGGGKVFRGKKDEPANEEEVLYFLITLLFLYSYYYIVPEFVENYFLVTYHMSKKDCMVFWYGTSFLLWVYRQSLNEIAVYEWYAGLWPHSKKMVVGVTVFCLIAYPIVAFFFPEW